MKDQQETHTALFSCASHRRFNNELFLLGNFSAFFVSANKSGCAKVQLPNFVKKREGMRVVCVCAFVCLFAQLLVCSFLAPHLL